MTKSKAAFLLTCEKLFDIGDPVYFWTFTFKNVYPDWWYPAAWRVFIREVGDIYGGMFYGVRVIEPHDEHGLHYHMLINRRISIHHVRRIAGKVGIFWVDVVKRPVDRAASFYLAKYLTKDTYRLYGVHRWHTVGALVSVRVNDVEVDSSYMRARRICVGRQKVPYGYEELLRRVYETHGFDALARCAHYLRQGKLASACVLYSPNIELTEKGGLRYIPAPPSKRIRYMCVKST